MTIKGSLQGSISIVKSFLTRNFPSPVENWRKFGVFRGKWGLNVKFCLRDPQKAHLCAKPRHLIVKIGAGVLAVGSGKNQKKLAESLDAHFRIFGGAKGGNRIVMKFCIGVGVPDVITHANLGDDRFRGF